MEERPREHPEVFRRQRVPEKEQRTDVVQLVVISMQLGRNVCHCKGSAGSYGASLLFAGLHRSFLLAPSDSSRWSKRSECEKSIFPDFSDTLPQITQKRGHLHGWH